MASTPLPTGSHDTVQRAAENTGRTCHVHIGMMKTGSTSIQAALHGYDDGSLRYLPHPLRNHAGLLRNAVQKQPEPLMRVIGQGLDDDELDKIRRRDRRNFRRMISEGDRNLIISSEELTSRFSRNNVNHLVKLLRAQFDQIIVIAYVREPVRFMTSMFQQQTKLRKVELDYEALYPDYSRLFQKWVDAVGTENMLLTQFSRDLFIDRDLVTDFAHKVGADPSKINRDHADLNQTLSAEAVAVLFAYRQLRGGPRDHPVMAKHNGRVIKLLQQFGSTSYSLDTDRCLAEIGRRSADIEWIQELMGSRFEYSSAPRDTRVFSDSQDVLDFAEASADSFIAHVTKHVPNAPRRITSIAEAFDVTYGLTFD
jgi:hypothetical protein